MLRKLLNVCHILAGLPKIKHTMDKKKSPYSNIHKFQIFINIETS